MHHTKKKKALGLIGDEKNTEAITKILLENNFTQDEVGEVLALVESGDNGGSNNAKASTSGDCYEEWRCQVNIIRDEGGKETRREPEKIKVLRKCVKISDTEAETLNNGALYSPRQDYIIMYFKPE